MKRSEIVDEITKLKEQDTAITKNHWRTREPYTDAQRKTLSRNRARLERLREELDKRDAAAKVNQYSERPETIHTTTTHETARKRRTSNFDAYWNGSRGKV